MASAATLVYEADEIQPVGSGSELAGQNTASALEPKQEMPETTAPKPLEAIIFVGLFCFSWECVAFLNKRSSLELVKDILSLILCFSPRHDNKQVYDSIQQ